VKRAFQVILCIGLFFLHNGCTSSINQSPKTSNESAEIRVKRYETRARTYQALADAQNLSPAYSNPGFRNYSKLGGHNLRMVYLQEVIRYRKLAKQAKNEIVNKNKEVE
jgi:hypothetical protein